MKKYILLLGLSIFALALLTCAGCGGQATSTTPPQQDASSDNGTEVADEPDAAALAANGYELYLHVSGGGDAGSEPAPRLSIDGMDYRQLGSDIDRKEKLEAYLGQVFTGEAIYYYLESAGIKEVEGKLYQPDADGGSILDWDQAAATRCSGDAAAAQYDLSVPSGADGAPETTTILINYAVEGGSWKVASNPAEIY